jgi:hypothetical protein
MIIGRQNTSEGKEGESCEGHKYVKVFTACEGIFSLSMFNSHFNAFKY